MKANRLHVLAATLALPAAVAAAVAMAAAAQAAPGTAQGPAATPVRPSLPRPDIKEWTLPNGLTVVLAGVHRAPVATVQVWYHAGSKDEPRDRRGSAHMFEHMMFKGTKNVPPEEHARLLDRVGGRANAFTTEDVTVYDQTLPASHVDFAIRLEAERMRNLLFRAKMIDTEREVVKEEIRETENHPLKAARVRFRELAFARHPYAWDAGGRIADLDATKAADLQRFYDAYYQPNNAVLVVVGDVSEQAVRESAGRWFGPIPRGQEPPRPARNAAEPPQRGLRREVLDKTSHVGVVIGGYHVPAARDDDMYPLTVMASIMSDGESSRLSQRIVRKDKIGVFAGMFLEPLEDSGMLLVIAAHLSPEQGAKCEAALLEEAARLKNEKVSDAELLRAKNQLAAKLVLSLQDVEGVAVQIGMAKLLHSNSRRWLDAYDKYLSVTSEDVMRVAKRYLAEENLTLLVLPPAGGAGGGEQ